MIFLEVARAVAQMGHGEFWGLFQPEGGHTRTTVNTPLLQEAKLAAAPGRTVGPSPLEEAVGPMACGPEQRLGGPWGWRRRGAHAHSVMRGSFGHSLCCGHRNGGVRGDRPSQCCAAGCPQSRRDGSDTTASPSSNASDAKGGVALEAAVSGAGVPDRGVGI